MHRVWKVAVGVALAAVTGGYAMAQDIVMTVGERSFSVTLEETPTLRSF